MRLFIKRLFLFCLLVPCFSFIPFYVYMKFLGMSFNDLPAPRITNSFTFNEKMAFMRKKEADIIGIGASGTLKNLNSELVVDYFKSKSYLNTSSWGFTVHDSYMLLKLYAKIHKPKKVIMVAGMLEFTMPDKAVNYDDLKVYLTTTGFNETYFKYIYLCYDLTEMLRKKDGNDKNSSTPEKTLIYDSYGATPVKGTSTDGRKLEEANDKHIFDDLLPKQQYDKSFEYNYQYLDSISLFCKYNGINLYFIQSPIEESMRSNFKKGMVDRYAKHLDRVKKIIIDSGGHHFVNGFDRKWDDSLFIDPVHFNASGAKLFTQYCFDKFAEAEKR